ncbi:hypothetical protein HBI29_000680 [Parastagonospora nodorum]|nr:hypothetical protein HBI76_020810 [Parastagonospora nodorum]KAH5260422.1 hypothetical protein HBI72_113130 [Parastagonospora nodorum]KAH5528335.1 hypothetical protein HBI29_000680 [Parastagonospora nodorum]
MDYLSTQSLFGDVMRLSKGEQVTERAQFKEFVQYCRAIDKQNADTFWASRFDGPATIYPSIKPGQSPKASDRTSFTIHLPSLENVPHIQIPSFIELAWALVLSSYAGSDIVAFGFVMSGRTTGIGKVNSTLGPTATLVPIQMNLDRSVTIQSHLTHRLRERRKLAQSNALQYGLSNIARVSENARIATGFQTVLNILSAGSLTQASGTTDFVLDVAKDPSYYSLALFLAFTDDHIQVDADFDSGILDKDLVQRLLEQLEYFLQDLTSHPQYRTLDEIRPIGDYHLETVSKWNSVYAPIYDNCLHELFSKQALVQECRPAIEAWDGHATYAELDAMSSKLAYDLVQRGFTTGDTAILYLDRSLFAIVASIATLKAGGVCVPVNVKHSRIRTENLIKGTGAKFVLTSDIERSQSVDLAPNVITVNEASIAALKKTGPLILPHSSSESVAYILHTSGSSGTPKGVVLEHRSLSTVMMAFAKYYGFQQRTRTLQFASHVWDASLGEIFGTLLSGGTICVPSERDRLGNLSAYINSSKVNWTTLTPTVLRTLDPADILTLEVVGSAGEAVDASGVDTWGTKVRFFNVWGVSEASMISTGVQLTPDSMYPDSIGFPICCSVWIVNAAKEELELVPIGAVGELVIEGPGVAQGYLNEDAKTAASFPKTPIWAPERSGQPPWTRRFYRSGDLAKYNPDGSICLIGRQDDQVKINGQRTELGEIEKTILAHENVRSAVVVAQKAVTGGSTVLHAVLSLRDPTLPQARELGVLRVADNDLKDIQDFIMARLPVYMCPRYWTVVETLPRSMSTKIDRTAIKEWLSQRDGSASVIDIHADSGKPLTAPESEAEKALQSVLCDVLALPISEIGRETGFLSLGGDSVTAMQVTAKLQAFGYFIDAANLLKSRNLATVASTALREDQITATKIAEIPQETAESSVSPIQHLFLHNSGPACSPYFNQCLTLEFRSETSTTTVRDAFQMIATQHSIIASASDSALVFRSHTIEDVCKASDIIKKSEAALNIHTGPVFSVDLIEVSSGKRLLFLAAHHLVVDMVSWRIILQDFENIIRQSTTALGNGISFPAWIQHQSSSMSGSLDQWPRADLQFWDLDIEKFTQGSPVRKDFCLDPAVSQMLLGPCNTAFNTTATEFLLAAVVKSFLDVFPDRGFPALFVETHGRQSDNTGLDASRTVGWFTSIFPVLATLNAESSIEHVVAAIKDQYRRSSENNQAAFASRMSGPDPLRRSDLEICFNFLGRLQQLEQPDGLFRSVPAMTPANSREPVRDSISTSLISVNAIVLEQRLQFHIEYNGRASHQDRLQRWIVEMERSLNTMARHFADKNPQLTLDDMRLLKTDYPSLSSVNQHLSSIGIEPSAVQEILPCSPSQEGMLLAEARFEDSPYWMETELIFSTSDPHESLDIQKISDSWRAVCWAHSIFRTVFISCPALTGPFQQVVLSDPTLDISIIHDASEVSKSLRRPNFTAAQPHHRLILKRGNESVVSATLMMDHTLCDATAVALLIQQWGLAYSQHGHLQEGRKFSEYLSWIEGQQEPSRSYWQKYLRGIRPCLVLTSDSDPGAESGLEASRYIDTTLEDASRIHTFCQTQGITVANLMQVAWGLTLKRITRAATVCFGTLYSGRDTVEGAKEIVAPLINMLVCRFDILPNTTVKDLCVASIRDTAKFKDYPICPLGALQDSLGLGSASLFNTTLSVQRGWTDNVALADGPIKIKLANFAIVVNVLNLKDSISYRLRYRISQISDEVATEVSQTFHLALKLILEDVSKSAVAVARSAEPEPIIPAPLSLLDKAAADDIRRAAASQCETTKSRIEDIFPCLPIQAERFQRSGQEQDKERNFTRHIFRLTTEADLERLCAVFDIAALAVPAVRTRIVSNDGRLFQVVLKSGPRWMDHDDLEECLELDGRRGVRFGGPLCHFDRIEGDNNQHIVVSIHHAIHDDSTLRMFFSCVESAYQGGTFDRLLSLNGFAHYMSVHHAESNHCRAWWKWLGRSADEASTWPPARADHTKGTTIAVKRLQMKSILDQSDPLALVQAAWSLVVSRLTGSQTVLFGTFVRGREASVPGVSRMTGPLDMAMPCLMELPPHAQISEILGTMRSHWAEICRYSHMGTNFAVSENANTALAFHSLLDVNFNKGETGSLSRTVLDPLKIPVVEVTLPKARAELTVTCNLEKESTAIVMSFDPRIVSNDQVDATLRQYEHAIIQLASSSSVEQGVTLSQLKKLSDYDVHLLKSWNSRAPVGINSTLHGCISEVAARQPAAMAIRSWDRNLNYEQLDSLSDKLATQLEHYGVKPGSVVPLLCEKSTATIVIMLGIMKAGSAMLGLDVNHPLDRLSAILHDVNPPLLLSNSSKGEEIAGLGYRVIRLDATHIENLPTSTCFRSVAVQPSDGAYVIYTSGSTGQPKGIMVNHENILGNFLDLGDPLCINESTRMMQFSSFAFDQCIGEIFLPLLYGGTLCVPSEEERTNDREGAIDKFQATYSFMTPSLAQMLIPARVPSLQTLALGGEAITQECFSLWRGHVRLLSAYGPAETACLSSCPVVMPENILNIGRPHCARYWVVDQEDHNVLQPIGGTGELLIEGPVVTKGYLNNPTQTEATFISAESPPTWVRDLGLSSTHRFYKTGDIVVQEADGTVSYRRRKDSQVKLHGNRIELEEIEYHIRRHLDAQWLLAVVLSKPNGSLDPVLIAFMSEAASNTKVSHSMGTSSVDDLLPPRPRNWVTTVRDSIADSLPAYMVPDYYVPTKSLTLNVSGKLDRKRLANLGERLSIEVLQNYHWRHESPNSPYSVLTERRILPPNPREQAMQRLWSHVLKVPESSLSPTSDWHLVGGNSLRAIQLVASARHEGFAITVADVFRNPILGQLANMVVKGEVGQKEPSKLPAFALVRDYVDAARDHACRAIGIPMAQIEDILPCTPLQEGMIAVTSRRSNAFIGKTELELHSTVDIKLFKRAWEELVANTPILRTRIVDIPNRGLVQVVVNQPVEWIAYDQDEHYQDPLEGSMPLGAPLQLVGVRQKSNGTWYWEVVLHHAIYDGWSLSLIIDALKSIYFGLPSPSLLSFDGFVKELPQARSEAGLTFWRNQFSDLNVKHFPSLPAASYRPEPDAEHRHIIDLPGPPMGFTLATAVRASWAAILSLYTGRADTVFGCVSNGRQANIPGIERIAGPTLASFPIRIKVEPENTVRQFLLKVQNQGLQIMQWEQTGLQTIAKVSPEADAACRYQTQLVFQDSLPEAKEESQLFKSSRFVHQDRQHPMSAYGILLVVTEGKHNIEAQFVFDSNVIDSRAISRLAIHFQDILQRVCSPSLQESTTVSEVQEAGDADLRSIWDWNYSVPKPALECVHNILSTKAQNQRQAPAVDAWDGKLTYGDFDDLSTGLSSHLINLGVTQEIIVPLFLERSCLTPVAAMAVIKAGGAACILNVSQSREEIQAVLSTVRPVVMMASEAQYKSVCQLSNVPVVMVSREQVERFLTATVTTKRSITSSDNALYVTFTYSTPGTPKGVVATHGNLSSAFVHHSRDLNMKPDSRVLDFSSCSSDAFWFNLLHTLHNGGCILLPTEQDLQSNASEAISRFKPNYIHSTPTIMEHVNSQVLGDLENVNLTGETGADALVSKLRSTVARVSNMYGSSESTTFACFMKDFDNPTHIGTAVGSVSWVVNPSTNRLTPIGCIGELCLEGPLIARGYLDNEQKTKAAFVKNPPWLLQGVPGDQQSGREGSIYRTGDLVKYEEDGSLTFVGRKDNQATLGGLMIETDKLCSRIVRHLNETGQRRVLRVIAEFPSNGQSYAIVFFVVLEGANTMSESELQHSVIEMTAGLDGHLEDLLPRSNIKIVYLPLASTPLASTGRVDHRKLSALATSHLHSQPGQPVETMETPFDDTESALRKIWSEVLAVPVREISLDSRWIRIGGDSITAMQAVGKARDLEINLQVSDIIKLHTIRRISAAIKSRSHSKTSQKLTTEGTRFALAPNQQWYLEHHRIEYCFDAPFLLAFTRVITPEELQAAIRAIVQKHSMLRARFTKTASDVFEQCIQPDSSACYHFASYEDIHQDQVGVLIRRQRERLNVEAGPMLVVALFELTDHTQSVFLSAHHFVSDHMSMQIIISDLGDLLSNRPLQPMRSTEFQSWLTAQRKYAEKHLHPDTILPHHHKVTGPQLGYWGLTDEAITTNPNIRTLTIDATTSSLILSAADRIFRAKVDQILIAALLYGFRQAFPDRSLPPCVTTSHGRIAPAELEVELSQVVGWFTTLLPVRLADSEQSLPGLAATVKAVKDASTNLSDRAWESMASRYLHPAGKSLPTEPLEELFLNFVGDFKQVKQENSVWRILPLPPDSEPESVRSVRFASAFEVHGIYSSGELVFTIRTVLEDRFTERLMECFKEALVEIGTMS